MSDILLRSWILIIPVWLAGLLVARGNRAGMKRATDMSWYTGLDRLASFASMLLMFAFLGASAFVPVDPSSPWFHAGLALVAAGFAAHLAAKRSFGRAGAGVAATTGAYALSRNPMYASFSVVMLGATVAGRSAVLAALWLLTVIATHLLIRGEERHCLETYGDAYRDYMGRVPRYFLFF